MSNDINLLLYKNSELQRERKKVRIANTIAITFSIIVGIASMFAFVLIQSVNPSSIAQEQESTLKEISRLQDKQAKLFIINDRLTNIEEVFQDREDLSKNINSLLSNAPNNLSIENLEMDNKSLVLTISSSSLLSINDFINNLIDMARKKEIIRSLTLSGLTFDESKNTYLVSLKSEL